MYLCAAHRCGIASCHECVQPVCTECSTDCDDCNATVCFECVDTCEHCAKMVCKNCVNVLQNEKCPCCKLDDTTTVRLCTGCVVDMWISPDKCNTCDHLCADNGYCKRRDIMANQQNCPVCWDNLDEMHTALQECAVHRVCQPCASSMYPWAGCPLCREGHFVL